MTDYVFAETQGAPSAPLIFTFHGTGGSERQFHDFALQMHPKAHVISPRGDVSEHGALRFFRRMGEGRYDMADLAQRADAMAAFLRGHVDRLQPSRVMAFGYSNGANILATVAFDHPGLFTDIGLLHPLIPWTPDPQPGLKNKAVFLSSGARDPICPPSQTQALRSWFEDQGSKLSVFHHQGGHDVTQDEVNALAQFLAA